MVLKNKSCIFQTITKFLKILFKVYLFMKQPVSIYFYNKRVSNGKQKNQERGK